MKYLTDINQLDLTKSYTYVDYLSWRFSERVELIMGKIFKMSPAPSPKHQYISSLLNAEFVNYLKGKRCKSFAAPFDVYLPVTNSKGESNTVVQPDICIICDEKVITERGCEGVPELIVEIVSKSTVTRDLHEKYDLYELCGVKEYWIINPNDKSLNIFVLGEHGKYMVSKPMTYGDRAKGRVLPGLEINLDDIFQDVIKEPEEGYLAEGTKRL